MLHFIGVVVSVFAFSHSEVGFLTTQKFTHEIPANIPQTGARNPARYIRMTREFRFGARTSGRRWEIPTTSGPDFVRRWGAKIPPVYPLITRGYG